MKAFNLYWKSQRVNQLPLSREELGHVLDQKTIRKKLGDGSSIEIPTSELVVRKCTVI